jgi:hypothetical protein
VTNSNCGWPAKNGLYYRSGVKMYHAVPILGLLRIIPAEDPLFRPDPLPGRASSTDELMPESVKSFLVPQRKTTPMGHPSFGGLNGVPRGLC